MVISALLIVQLWLLESSMLPIHPRPQKDELLSSWLIRLSLSNGYCSHTFFKHVLGYDKEIWTRDIDRSATKEFIALLSKETGQTIEQVNKLCLRSLVGYLFEELKENAKSHWILPLGIRHRIYTHNGMQCCPVCLREKVVYFRLHWRLSFYTICEKHHCLLIDHCPNCKKPIDFRRHAIGAKREYPAIHNLRLCGYCLYDLSKASIVYPNKNEKIIIAPYIEFIKNYIKGTWNLSLSPASSLPYYNGIWVLSSWLAGRKSKIIMDLLRYYSRVMFKKTINTHNNEFEYLSLEERFNLFILTFWFIDDWPKRFIRICNDANINKSDFTDYYLNLPFFLLSLINEKFNKSQYIPNKNEVLAVKNKILNNGMMLSPRELRRYLNISMDLALKILHCDKKR